MMSASLTPPRLHTQLIRAALLVAAGLAAAAALGGSASAQQADACQSQVNRVTDLEEMLGNIPHARYQIDLAKRDLRDCRERVAESEQEQLVSERNRHAQDYLDATNSSGSTSPRWQEASDAHVAWKEADEAVRNHAGYVPGQPYNDGLSDFERYYCLQQRDEDSDNSVADVETHGDPGYTYTSNMISATCWD